MIQLTLVGVGCQKCWELEDRVIRLSREIGVPVEIRKIMDLDRILELGLATIPAILYQADVWSYEMAMSDGDLRQLIICMNESGYVAGR